MPTAPHTTQVLPRLRVQRRMTAMIAAVAALAITVTLIIVLASSGGSTRASSAIPRSGVTGTSQPAPASNAGHGLVP
jgi:hypothetical protein